MKKKRLYSTLCAWLFSALAIGGNISAMPLMPENILTASAYLTGPAEGKCGENAVWTLDSSGKLTITGTGAIDVFSYSDSNWDRYAKNIKEVVIEKGITEIGNYTFSNYPQLMSVSIPDSVTSIGVSAFNECEKLTGIMIPASVTTLKCPLTYETGIQAITVDPENPVYCSADGVVFSKDMTKLVCVPDGYAATEYAIPDSVTVIGKDAFYCCRRLNTVIIPDSVTEIGDGAFNECKSLNTVSIPDSVTSIGEYAFSGCDALTGITIPASVTSLANSFDNYTPLRSITVDPENPVYCSVDGVVFSRDMTKLVRVPEAYPADEYTIPGSVTEIGDEAFFSCDKLTAVSIPEGVEVIGKHAFCFCMELVSVDIPESVTVIRAHAFNKCDALQHVTMPKNLTEMGDAVFYLDAELQSVELPKNLTVIPGELFYSARKLKKAEIPLVAVNGILIDASAASGEVTVPDGVTFINPYAFMDCDAITKITLPEHVAKIDGIGSAALTDVTILNPECVIKDDEGTITNGYDGSAGKATFNGTIRGYEGSTAQAYAKKYGYKFEALKEVPQITTAPAVTTTTAKTTVTTAVKTTAATTKAAVTTAKTAATTAKAPATTAKAITTIAKATTAAAPVTTAAPTETTPIDTTSAAPAPLRGDVTGDGQVSVDDAQLTLKAYTERIAGNDMNLTPEQIIAADIDCNGEVSVEDAQWLLKYYTEKYVARKDITWDDILGKNTQALPRLIKKRFSR